MYSSNAARELSQSDPCCTARSRPESGKLPQIVGRVSAPNGQGPQRDKARVAGEPWQEEAVHRLADGPAEQLNQSCVITAIGSLETAQIRVPSLDPDNDGG